MGLAETMRNRRPGLPTIGASTGVERRTKRGLWRISHDLRGSRSRAVSAVEGYFCLSATGKERVRSSLTRAQEELAPAPPGTGLIGAVGPLTS